MPTATVAPSFQDLVDLGQSEAQSRRPDMPFLEGDFSLAQLHAVGAMADHTVGFAARKFRDTFLDGAHETALEELGEDRTGQKRHPATKAQGTGIQFTRTDTSNGGTIDAGTRVATDFTVDGKQVVFLTDDPIVVGIGQAGPFAVNVTAEIEGRDGNVLAGKVVKILDTLFNSTFTVTNPTATAGGNELETEDAYRKRVRDWYRTLRRGTLAALEFGAKVVPSVRVAVATDDEITGLVAVYVSDEDGQSTLQMIADVTAELENWRGAGPLTQVFGSEPLAANVTIQIVKLRTGSSYSAAAGAATIVSAVQTRIKKLRDGEGLYNDMIVAAVISTAPDDILNVTVTINGVEHGDLIPAAGKVVRPGTITVTT